MSALPSNGSLLSLPGTQGEWNQALNLDPGRANGLDYADCTVQVATPIGRRAPSLTPDLLDAAVLDQVFADMA
jgi:hypothetical protein